MTLLNVQGATKRFGGLVAVCDVGFEIQRGEVLGVIGPNGAGKSTLLGMISGFIAPTSGSVSYRGEAVVGLAPHLLVKRGLSRSFQIVQTFADMTVREVVTAAALSKRVMHDAEQHADMVIDQVGLGGKESKVPAILSLQDKKLLELAKCVATDPELILLDEVMAGLTLAEAEAPLQVIQRLNKAGVTVIMVEHVMPVIMKIASRLVVIEFGKLIADDQPQNIIKDPRVIEAYFGAGIDA